MPAATAVSTVPVGRWRRVLRDRSHGWALVATGIACALAAALLYTAMMPKPRVITQEDIDGGFGGSSIALPLIVVP